MNIISTLRSTIVGIVVGATCCYASTGETEQNQIKPDLVRIEIQTEIGSLVLQLDVKRAPGTVENFLRYVDAGFFNGASFYRVTRDDNQGNSPVSIQVIQGGSGQPDATKETRPPIPLERTRDTGLRHEAGTISMARGRSPDSATTEFFICISAEPELDWHGMPGETGEGFAAFGQVIEGMDIAKAIHRASAEAQSLSPAIKILRIVRTVESGRPTP